jgi:hypothetical protein
MANGYIKSKGAAGSAERIEALAAWYGAGASVTPFTFTDDELAATLAALLDGHRSNGIGAGVTRRYREKKQNSDE